MHDILDVIQNIQDLYENNSSLAVLKDFERVLDEMDMYVYKNWQDGRESNPLPSVWSACYHLGSDL